MSPDGAIASVDEALAELGFLLVFFLYFGFLAKRWSFNLKHSEINMGSYV